MKVENPAALHFILQDDIYLLNHDKKQYINAVQPPPDIKTKEVSFNYLGQNKKNFLIIVSYPGQEHILDSHLTALESVLNRKGHNLGDVAIVNLATHADIQLKQLVVYFNPQTLLILGNNAIPADMDALTFNVPAKIKGINSLYTYSFEEMMSNTENKKAFWEQVKTL